jgi:hypothetical protein
MNANQMKAALCACGFVAAGLTVSGGPLQRSDVSAQTAWIVHLDVDRLRPTAVGQHLLAEMDKPEARSGFAVFQSMLNFDPRKQLHGLTLYGTGASPETGVLMVYGDFDPDRLISTVQGAQDYQSSPYKTHVIHNWIDDKKKAVNGVKPRVYGAVQGKNIVLLAQQEAVVAKALDVLDHTTPGLAGGNVFPQLGASGNTSVIQAAARKLDIPDSAPQAAVLRLAKGAFLQIGEAEGRAKATLNLETSDPDVAQLMATVGHGLVALMKLQRDNPGTQKLAEAFSLKQDGAHVIATLAMPTGEVVDLMKADAARKSKKQAEKEQ